MNSYIMGKGQKGKGRSSHQIPMAKISDDLMKINRRGKVYAKFGRNSRMPVYREELGEFSDQGDPCDVEDTKGGIRLIAIGKRGEDGKKIRQKGTEKRNLEEFVNGVTPQTRSRIQEAMENMDKINEIPEGITKNNTVIACDGLTKCRKIHVRCV